MNGKIRALLVYPAIPDTYWSFKHALAFVGKRAALPPLGLATVAAMLPADWDLRLVDMNIEKLADRDIRAADLVFLSAMIVQKDSFAEVVARCNRLSVPVVAGGPYPTSCRTEIQGVDHFVLGEAEVSLPGFLVDWRAGRAGPCYAAEEKPGLDRTPVPRYDLLKIGRYNTMSVQFSRGCPFDCEFCDIVSLFGHVPRTKSPERFLAELDAVLAAGFKGGVFIVDDNFIGNKKKVKDLLAAIAVWQDANGRPFTFSTEASIDLAADEELLGLMQAVGFTMVFVGLETPVESSLAETGKRQNLRYNVLESVRRIQSRGIEVSGGFIVGFDSDPPDVFERQVEFIRELAVPTAMVGLLQALPNTQLSRRLEREGRLRAGGNGNNTHDTGMNFVPRLPADYLAEGYERLLKAVYEPRVYFQRCLDFLFRIAPDRKHEARPITERMVTARNLLALVSSLVRQSFSSYGRTYLGFIIKALRRYPGELVRIFTMAVQGHHFFTLTRIIGRRGQAGRAGPAY